MTDPGDLAKLADRAARAGERAGDLATRATERVGELEILIRQLSADVVALRDLAQSRADGEDARVVRSWLLTTDPDVARRTLDDLARWLDEVYLTYHGVTLASCWLWHPSVIEELVALREAHHDAFAASGASWKAVGDWHERYRPGVVGRVKEALGACELGQHVPGGTARRPACRAPLTAAVGTVAQAWVDHRGTPEPTDEQITEAKRHDARRSNRTEGTRSRGEHK